MPQGCIDGPCIIFPIFSSALRQERLRVSGEAIVGLSVGLSGFTHQEIICDLHSVGGFKGIMVFMILETGITWKHFNICHSSINAEGIATVFHCGLGVSVQC